jgi:hypothetical protein
MIGAWTASIVTLGFIVAILVAIEIHKNDSNKGNPPGRND